MTDYDFWNPGEPDLYKDMGDDERIATTIYHIAGMVICFVIMLGLCAMCSSCTTTQYIPVIEHHTDTLIQTKVQHDSIYINDSTVITEKGDTVKIEKWHTKYVEKQVHDTTYVAKRDSVPYPVEVVKEVQRPLAKTQITMMVIGFICTFLVVIYIGRKIRGLLP